jgi:Polyketide cyclase / dehydrase and lipid transport
MRQIAAAVFLVSLIAPLVAQQQTTPATPPRPAPAPLQVPNPHYVTVVLTQDVDAPADTVWARVGKFCDIGEWAFPSCKLIQGDGGFASERTIVNEVLVGKTDHSYTYTQPVRKEGKYNLYHGTLEVQPVTVKTSRLVYTFFYDNSMLADDAARNAEMATRKKRFSAFLVNMKTLAEGGTLPASAIEGMPTTTPTPEQLQTANPHYVAIPMTLNVNAPVDAVWARIGKYCDIGEWGIPNCTILSGDGGLGTIRSIGNEVLVGKTKYSYTYTQPVREGVAYNMYHGTLEAVPLNANTTRLNYTLVFDNSHLADDAARDKDLENRRTRFTKMLENMKVLCEGGTLAPGALGGGGAATRPAGPRPVQ